MSFHTPVVHVGEAPPDLPSDYWNLTTVYIHGFADLPQKKGSYVTSSDFRCLGHTLNLKLYPRGDEGSGDGEEQVSLYLRHRHRGDESINIDYSLTVRDATSIASLPFRFERNSSSTGRGFVNFIERKTALTSLVKGVLVIEVRTKEVFVGSSFVPRNPSTGLTLENLFIRRSISGDVMFKIGGGVSVATGNENERPTKKQMSSETFYAHRCILMIAAPQLAELCTASPDDKSPILVPLHNVPAHAFEALLRYIYGYNVLHVGKDIERIKDILEAADRFDVVDLKLKAEDILISAISLDIDNAIDHYLYAESKNCAALKEKVVAFIVDNWKVMYVSNKVQDIPDIIRLSFTNDVIFATKVKDEPGDHGPLDTRPVGTLRRKAHDKCLKYDGTKETLISLLNDH